MAELTEASRTKTAEPRHRFPMQAVVRVEVEVGKRVTEEVVTEEENATLPIQVCFVATYPHILFCTLERVQYLSPAVSGSSPLFLKK
jgi:hypothetical protein